MQAEKLLQDPSLVRFLEQTTPKRRCKKLEKFKEYIFFLKENGYSDQQIADFLKTEKQVAITQQAVNKFIRSRKKTAIHLPQKTVVLKQTADKKQNPIKQIERSVSFSKSQDTFKIDDVPLSDLI